MRSTWDALASDPDVFVGDPARAKDELDALFGRLGGDPRGGTCVEVGSGPGRMTKHLARRFDCVIAVDVSPAMLAQARANVGDAHVEFRTVDGDKLDSIDDGIADVVVCYLVLQHLPSGEAVVRYFAEFARVLKPHGQAYVQLPVLDDGVRPRAWRAFRSLLVPVTAFRGPTSSSAFRGFRLTARELHDALARARLRVVTRTTEASPYRYSRDVFLRLERA
jgi:ubiquinone/menaquinone biosynthesis C-methylase UbiE